MARNDELHPLVRSLSMQEKRHFKLFAQRYSGGGSNYIKLFDAVAAQPVYDEEKLRRKLKGEVFLKHLAFEKHHLQQLITRALRLYHSGKNIDLRLKEMLLDAEILHERSLYHHCRKTLQKARKLARVYERFVFIPEITRLESRLFDLQNLEEVYREETDALQKMQVINKYRTLSNKVALLVASAHQVRKRSDLQVFERIMRDPLMRKEDKADTFTARVYYFYIQAVYYEMKGDLKNAYRSRKRFVELIESEPTQLKIHTRNYLSALNNLAISQLELRLFSEAAETVEKIRKVPLHDRKSEDIRVNSFVFSVIIELNIAIRTGMFVSMADRLPSLERAFHELEKKIQPQFCIVILNSIKYVYFGLGEYRQSLKWSNRVMHETDAGVRQDIQAMARIFNLVLHYELGNTELLEYMIRSTYRFLLKSERLYKVETVVLQYLRRAAFYTSPKEINASFGELLGQLEPLSRTRYEKKAFEEFDLLAWLQCKISKKPFATIVKEGANTLKKPQNRLKIK